MLTLARLCDSVLELTCEATLFSDRIAFGGVRDEAEAVASELRYLAAYLAWSAGETEIDDQSRAEHKLADIEERVAEHLLALAAELDAGASAAVEVEN